MTHGSTPNPELLATSVYDLSADELMAHTIRAVQSHIYELRKRKHFKDQGAAAYAIVVKEFDPPIEELAFIGTREMFIQINWRQDHNAKRRRIAHELAHLLLAAHAVARDPDFYTFNHAAATEDLCDRFAEKLCTLHDGFYRDPKNWKKLFFGDLPGWFRRDV